METASMQSLHSDLAVSHMCCVNLMMTYAASVRLIIEQSNTEYAC